MGWREAERRGVGWRWARTSAVCFLGLPGLLGCGSSDEGGASGGLAPPQTCTEVATPYRVEAVALDGSLAPITAASGFGAARSAYLPVAAAADGRVYVGMTSNEGAVIAEVGGDVMVLPGTRLGGVTATDDGVAVLLFDPEEGRWAAVRRFSVSGEESFDTHLFHSPNLEDEGTKGEPGSSRVGYWAERDDVVAYFGHTQRYSDGVRHQGGYLATVSSEGEQNLLNGWFGSHNLDQRMWTEGAEGAVLGLGDAYPIGIFFARLGDRPRPHVVYRYAAAPNGTANGQLGGLIDSGDELIASFITNRSVSPDLDAGTWPDIDSDVADLIRAGANQGTDLGLLRIPKTGDLPEGDVPTVWIEPELAEGARLERLKSARYGGGKLILLLWGETTGGNRNATTHYYTMVVEPSGAVCQPKTPLDEAYAVTGGDDIVRAPDGSILWANDVAGSVSLVRLTP